MFASIPLLLLSLFLSVASPAAALSQSTPGAHERAQILGGDVVSTELALQITWGPDAEPLPGVAGWQPVSFRMIETEDAVYAFIELRNVSGAFAYTPQLHVELFQDDFSFGTFTFMFGAETPWAEPDGSAFYQSLSFYDNSLGVADWNGMALGVTADTYDAFNGLTSQGLKIEGRRLINETALDIPPVRINTFVRDKDGIYSGSCIGPTTGARTPAGGSVRLSEAVDREYTPRCGFSIAGMEGSEHLGIGGPYTTEYYIVGFDQ